MEINFKPLENTDIPHLVSLIQGFYAIDCYPFEAQKIEEIVLDILSDRSLGRVWLIQTQQENVGYVILSFTFSVLYGGRCAFVDELYIRAAYRNQGIGTQTLQFIEEVCNSLELGSLLLEVELENEKGQRFYHRLGYQDVSRYLMEKKLNRQSTTNNQ